MAKQSLTQILFSGSWWENCTIQRVRFFLSAVFIRPHIALRTIMTAQHRPLVTHPDMDFNLYQKEYFPTVQRLRTWPIPGMETNGSGLLRRGCGWCRSPSKRRNYRKTFWNSPSFLNNKQRLNQSENMFLAASACCSGHKF
jgi:hypothetical protein